jgi:hypothetical protein
MGWQPVLLLIGRWGEPGKPDRGPGLRRRQDFQQRRSAQPEQSSQYRLKSRGSSFSLLFSYDDIGRKRILADMFYLNVVKTDQGDGLAHSHRPAVGQQGRENLRQPQGAFHGFGLAEQSPQIVNPGNRSLRSGSSLRLEGSGENWGFRHPTILSEFRGPSTSRGTQAQPASPKWFTSPRSEDRPAIARSGRRKMQSAARRLRRSRSR